MMNDFDRRYVDKILALHDEMRLDSKDEPEVRLWHALRSILEWCDYEGLDFDLLLADVKADFVSAP